MIKQQELASAVSIPSAPKLKMEDVSVKIDLKSQILKMECVNRATLLVALRVSKAKILLVLFASIKVQK